MIKRIHNFFAMDRKDLLKLYKIKMRPLILDGAIGSSLQTLSVQKNDMLWSSRLNLSNPTEVSKLHKSYIQAGADIITTNTFRTNPVAYNSAQLKITNEDFVKTAVEIAIDARGDENIIVAGSNAPAEDCYQQERTISKSELIDNHFEHIEYLWKQGCDIIWNETFSHLDEIEIVSNFCSSNNFPFTINIFLDKELKLLSGENLADVMDLIKSHKPAAIGFNCIHSSLLKNIIDKHKINYRWGFYLNCGSGNFTDTDISCSVTPAEYWSNAEKYLKYSPLYIGSCCGSNPAHTNFIKEKLNEIYSN
ncbi:MAG: homocysteine S-methyltransferase family protein [Ignavibacteriae bacterium]|nr:homocysteine S-methyltransferase family protein [Ignavibacteriota bacterium]